MSSSVDPPFKELVKTLMLSNLSYTDQIADVTRVIGYPRVTFMDGKSEGKDTQGYLLQEGKTLFGIFRGTESTQDMINDAEAVKWDSLTFNSNLKVHHGFHLQYKAIQSQLVTYLNVHHSEYDEVVFCGHSLGAALATIALVYYHYDNMDPNNPSATKYNKVTKIQSYGCPRLGNAAFGSYYSECVKPEHHWRVFNENDPAAKSPSQTTIFTNDVYMHVPGNALCLIGSEPVTYTVSQSDNLLNVPLNFVTQISQHHCSLYMSRLLSLHDQKEKDEEREEQKKCATTLVDKVLEEVVNDVLKQEEEKDSKNNNGGGGCVVC